MLILSSNLLISFILAQGKNKFKWSINDLFDYKETNNSRSISTRACGCYNQGICDPYTGLCICPSGFLGQQCEQLARKIKKNFY